METLGQLFDADTALSAFRLAMPLCMVALGALICERSGVLNVATEGMMLMGSFCAVAGTVYMANSLWLGLLAGLAGGLVVGLLLAALTVWVKADQVVAGVAINIFVLGITTLFLYLFLVDDMGVSRATTPAFASYSIPFLSRIPVVGQLIFTQQPPVYIGVVITFAAWFVLFRTKAGLTLRSVGEHARAADTVGIRVTRVRFIAVLLGGLLGGLGGALFALGAVQGFIENTTAGRGYIALAIVILGRWRPFGALAAALLFGLADALSFRVQGLGLPISRQIPQMLPYLVTLVALIAFAVVGRARMPAEDGKPYIKEEAS